MALYKKPPQVTASSPGVDSPRTVESQMLFYSRSSYTIPANTTLPVNIAFQKMQVLTGSNLVFATIGYSPNRVPIETGLGYGVGDKEKMEGKFYNGITLINTHSAPVSVTLIFTMGEIYDDRTNFQFSPNPYTKFISNVYTLDPVNPVQIATGSQKRIHLKMIGGDALISEFNPPVITNIYPLISGILGRDEVIFDSAIKLYALSIAGNPNIYTVEES